MNDYSRKSLINLGIFVLLALTIASFVVMCTQYASGKTVPFITFPLPVASMVYGIVSFIKKYLILK